LDKQKKTIQKNTHIHQKKMAVELQINFTEPFPEMMENPNHNVRRHSQSYAVCVSSTSDNLTTPYTRGRSFSTSAVSNCSPSSFAAHILASVNSTLKTMDEPEEHRFLDYVDGQVHETWETAKALMLGTKRLLLIHELPPDRRENQYVLSG
jgi:adiponectin receptor